MVLCGFVGERQKDRGNGDERGERNQIFNINLLRKIIIKKYILLILNPNLNPNSNLGIQTMEFQMMNFKSLIV